MIPERRRTTDEARATARTLLAHCREQDWAGYDPYDALNSRLFELAPVLNSRLPRLILTQALKRSPINVRSLMLVPKTQNPKGLSLFLAAVLRAPEICEGDVDALARQLVAQLVKQRSPNTPYWCWGYSFPWQTRTIVVPRSAPNLVCTTFVANSLLDAYERLGDERCLAMGTSAAEYIVNELYRCEGKTAWLSYPLPTHRVVVHNASFLGAALLCRVHRLTGDPKFVEPALRVARYSTAQQATDGSWPYTEAANQQWIDNFHTGFNLGALRDIGRFLETDEFEGSVRLGFDFYKAHFFRPDGVARYFHNRTYPIDIHCVAQSIITLVTFQDLAADALDMATSVFDWSKTHMWDPRGWFYYRVLRLTTIRTSYMRWSQAWMVLALAALATAVTHREARATLPVGAA
jgi:hypothetical protein